MFDGNPRSNWKPLEKQSKIELRQAFSVMILGHGISFLNPFLQNGFWRQWEPCFLLGSWCLLFWQDTTGGCQLCCMSESIPMLWVSKLHQIIIWGCRAFKACQLWKRFRLPWDAIAEPGLQCDVLGSLMWLDSVPVMQQWFGWSFAVHLRTVFQTSRCGMKAREERQVFMHLFYRFSDFSGPFGSHQCARACRSGLFYPFFQDHLSSSRAALTIQVHPLESGFIIL